VQPVLVKYLTGQTTDFWMHAVLNTGRRLNRNVGFETRIPTLVDVRHQDSVSEAGRKAIRYNETGKPEA